MAPGGFDALAGIASPILFLESGHPGLIDRVLLNTAAARQFLGLSAPGRWSLAEPAALRAVGLDLAAWMTWDWGDEHASETVDHRIGPPDKESWWRLTVSRVRAAAPLRLMANASRIDDLYRTHNLPDTVTTAVVEEIERLAGFGHYAFWPQRRDGLWSSGMARIWSVPEAQSPREFENMLALIHPTDLERRAAGGERATVAQDTQEVRIVRADGEVRNIRSIAAQHIDAEGRVQQVTRIDQDVTELRRAEEELRLAREAAGDAARAKEAFLHLMNHSLRTPLNAILGFGEAMRDQIYGPLSADYAQCIDAVNDSAQRLLELVDDILDLTRLESGRYSLSKSVCDLDQIIAETMDLMAPRVTERNLRLAAAAPSEDPVTVWGEE
ncbi:MAG: PAS domain-containing protein, partial [Alphaproteobacteria bacterium]|nr:PAS domain-containing protein [Alphaproteobacteria bacterium]